MKKKEIIKRLEVLEAIVNPKPVLESESKPTFKTVFMKCTQEQFDRMRPKLESVGCNLNGMNSFSEECCWLINDFIEPLHIDVFASGSDLKDGEEVHTEAEFLEACGYVEACKEAKRDPKVGDVVKAWDDDKSKFVYGVLNSINYLYFYHYTVGGTCYKNIELVTEISINDFKRENN